MTEIYPDPTESSSSETQEKTPFMKQAEKDFMNSAKSRPHQRWRRRAAREFDFVAGGSFDDSGQWDKADMDKLKDQSRPMITMNRIEPMIEGIVGAEINNRQEVVFQARETGDKNAALALMEAAKWARENDIEEEETDAFRDTLICGMGWTVHTMEYDEDLDGRYTVLASDPIGHYWDVDSRRTNLADARWIGYVERMTKDKFRVMFPDEKGSQTVFGLSIQNRDELVASAFNSDYDDPELQDVDGSDGEGSLDDIHVLEYQCYKIEPVFRIFDPNANKLSDGIEKPQFEEMRESMEAKGAVFARFGTPVDTPDDGSPPPVVIRFMQQQKKIYYRAFFSGDKLLGEFERSPWRNGFSRQCITGRRQRRTNTWYGVVRAMEDPQRFLNSFLSAAIHHYNSNPKGGLFYEEGAVDNPDELESKLAHPSPAISLERGGLAKIQMIQPAASSPALDRLLAFVSDMPPLVTGISLEALGLASRDQPVGLEQTRKMATMSIVSPMFSSYRKYRKISGRLLFDYLKDYVPEETLKRVLSNDMKPFAVAIKNAETLKFDIHVEDAPLSPSIKATVFSVFKDMLQFLPPETMKVILPDFLDFSPLPSPLVEKVKKSLQPQPPDPQHQIAKDLALKQIAADVEETESKTELNEAKTATELERPEIEEAKLDLAAEDQRLNFLQVQLQQQGK